jgi:hypothetical protein
MYWEFTTDWTKTYDTASELKHKEEKRCSDDINFSLHGDDSQKTCNFYAFYFGSKNVIELILKKAVARKAKCINNSFNLLSLCLYEIFEADFLTV